MEGSTAGKPKSKTKGNKKAEKEKDPKGKTTKAKGKEVVLNYAKFEGQGLNYKCKLFGFAEVPGPRGDRTSVEAIQKLKQQAKQQKKGTNEHKLKIIFNVTLQGVRVINEKTQTIEHEHQIHKISFISHDPEDRHIFGYIYSPPRTAEGRKYYLFAIKAEKSADVITCQLYELFQVVYKMQEDNKKTKSKGDPFQHRKSFEKSSQPLEPLQDKMLLEMSSKLGVEQQHTTDEHLYEEPIFLKSSPPVSPKGHYANANGEVESGFASSPFPQDALSSTTEADQTVSDKEASVKLQSPLPQVSSDNTFTSSINEDSGFEPGFDSAASSISTEPKVDDSFQFQAEFPPFQNGFSIPKTDLKDANYSEEAFDASRYSSSTEQFQPDAFKSAAQFENTFDINRDIEISDRESDQLNVEGTKITSKSNEKPHFKNVKEDEVSSESRNTFSADEVQPEVNENVATLSNVDDKSPTDAENASNFPPVSMLGNNAQENKTLDTKSENKNVSFGSADIFEAKFDINEKNMISEKSAFSSFSNSSEDPFSSHNTTDQDRASFGVCPDDDPFSPQGGTNRETAVSDPFAESDDIFSSDFSSKNNDDVFSEDKENLFISQTNRETEMTIESNNGEDDIFEAMFDAKMEQVEEINEEANETKSVVNMTPRENNVKINKQADTVNENPEKNGDETTTPAGNESQKEQAEGGSNDVSEKGMDVQMQAEQESEINTFDLATNDDYVTLKKAVQNDNRLLSPSDLSPPPLPPRPTLPVDILPSDYDEIPADYAVIPKEPPALPPRPSNQSFISNEHAIRKPPVLPPRVDLEERNSDPFSDNIEDSKTESAQNDAGSPLFQANFDSFDFNNAENSETTVALEVSTTVEFGITDPFKDPFVGADPFQTPIATDPFASSPSFVQRYKQDSDGFDPFSDDPFAATPSFDTQSSFDLPNSPFPTQPSFEETKEDQDKDKQFSDFSGFSSSFS